MNKISSIDGNLKLQKLMFLHEFKGVEAEVKSSYYKYFRYNLGPYSKDLANDVNRLEKSGLINKTNRKLTKRGQFFLDYFLPEVSRAVEPSLKYAKEVCQSFGRFSGSQLVDRVYKMNVPVFDLGGTSGTVRQIPMFTDIFNPVHDTGYRDLPSLDIETIDHMNAELSISPDDLDQSSPRLKKTANECLERALA